MKQAVKKQTQLKIALTVIIGILFLSGWLLYGNFKLITTQEELVLHTMDVISELDVTLSLAKDAETSVRGYILTNDPAYLEPYNASLAEAPLHIERIKELTLDNPEQRKLALVLESVLRKRINILSEIVKQSIAKGAAISKREALMSEGKNVMDNLRKVVAEMKNAEKAMLVSRTDKADASKLIFVWVLSAVIGLMTFVIVFSFWQISRAQRRSLDDAMEKANEAQKKLMVTEVARVITGDWSVEKTGSVLLSHLSAELGILAGNLWIREGGQTILAASYGIAPEELKDRGQPALVQAAMNRKSIWHVTDVPPDHWELSSGLGHSRPTSLLFLPFDFQGRRIGLLELANFAPLRPDSLTFLSEVADSIGIAMNASLSRARLQSLLEKTQQQSEELQTQQEELRTSNEELEQQARALETQQQAMQIKNRELENAQHDLQVKASDLQKSSLYKSEFLAKMSHELRTPLNGVLILSTLLFENKERNLTAQQKEFAQSIKNAGNDLLTLINDILDLSKIEARKLTLRPETFTLGQLIAATAQSFKPQANDKNLTLVTEISAETEHLILNTDRQRVDQILRNFLSNAIKFTETGSVKLWAALSESTVELSVSDSGIGIAKEKQRSIFEAFEQADSSVSRKYGGTGLGLTISRELAHLLKGEISLESHEGRGSTFTLKIPISLDAKNSSPPSADSRESAPVVKVVESKSSTEQQIENVPVLTNTALEALKGLDPAKKSILIVEDDDNFRLSIAHAVRSYGFNAVEATDGEMALAVLNNHVPDAILLDIKLPGISGLGILEMIKQLPHLRHIPVHMISGLEYQHNALRMGAFGYLTKPVTIEKVRSALDRIEDQISKKLRRVLLIEDDLRQSQAVAQLIAGEDLEVIAALTGKSAVETLKKEGFDCIILDLTLPDVSGFDLLAELRSLEISLPPIVIYTGKELSEKEQDYLLHFSNSIVIKGARSPERLLDEVNLFLHRVESLLPESTRNLLSQLRSQEQTFEGKTILLVDDDIRNIFALTSALESKGLTVRTARDGIEALERLEKNEDISLVLMDIMMPRMNGFEATRAIRTHKILRIKTMPVIAVTAKAMKEDHEKCMEAGANDYLPKPINLENLNTVLKVWLAPKGFLS